MKLDYTPKPCKIKGQKQRRLEVQERAEAIKEAELTGNKAEADRLKVELKLFKSQWMTPNTPEYPALMLVAAALGGEIGVDVTADERCLVPAHNHITAEDDFLHKDVHCAGMGSAFMNCDYARPGAFLAKLIMEYSEGNLTKAISLNKVGVLSNQGSGTLIRENASAVCLWGAGKRSPLTGRLLTRLAFIDCEDFLVPGTDFDSIFVYFGRDPRLFLQTFKPYGSCFIPA